MTTRISNRQRGSAAEIPLSLFVLFMMAVFPLVNMVSLGIACSTIFLTAKVAAERAAAQQSYKKALSSMSSELKRLNADGLHRFLHLRPVSGHADTGTNLFVQATSCSVSGRSVQYGPNSPVNVPIDTTNWLYEYKAESTYDVEPLLPITFIPIIGKIPGLGVPCRISMCAQDLAEYPLGLAEFDKILSLSGGTSPVNLRVSGLDIPGELTDLIDSGWDYPTIYHDIEKAGQTVVDEEVFLINAKNWKWFDTKMNVGSKNRVWIDYRAVGEWSVWQDPDTGFRPTWDADGNKKFEDFYGHPFNNTGFPPGSLLGKAGDGNPPFFLGRGSINFIPPTSGRLYLGTNDGPDGPGSSPDWFDNNLGSITVRVVVTALK
ncbi:MAG: hypothetical protein U0103_25185 [Candidatus Obscuribacterales bacterium]|nr:hypothetical protein [Cyanobacteria bacterium SZAS LIN-5]RTL35722.1 MAG: hypothetical protein EKK48_29015 [Candidatus Melainabacteria bacterium]